MKVLFVCSGNKGISPIVQAQADSLARQGLEIEFFPIVGKGLRGYIKNVPALRRHIKQSHPHIVHAHYSLSGIAASMASKVPVITSLMGSDVMQSWIGRQIIRFFVLCIWKATIVKSPEMRDKLQATHTIVIPNGVNTEIFLPLDKDMCREKIGWCDATKYVLFAANPQRPEKNFPLAQQAMHEHLLADCTLKVVHSISQGDIPFYLNAADVVLLTSSWEGSPNIIKEAMACNCRIVSTPVGDVPYLLEGVNGSWIVDAEPSKVAEGIREAVDFGGVCNGRERIASEQLDSASIARKIIELYRIQAG